MALTKNDQIKRFFLFLYNYLPIFLLILIFEGTFKNHSYIIIGLWIIVRVTLAVRLLLKTGAITNMERTLDIAFPKRKNK